MTARKALTLTLVLLPLLALLAPGAAGPVAAATGAPAAQQLGTGENGVHALYFPYVASAWIPEWEAYPLYNGDFEVDWSVASSHACLVFETDGRVEPVVRDNIFTPAGWVTWFKHGMPVDHDPWNKVGWSQPEVTDMWAAYFDYRVHSGAKAQRLFTFYKIHDAGFMQQVPVQVGDTLRLSGWAHAWSSQDNDGHCSEGADVGCDAFFALEGDPGLDGDERNFTFWIGIDPYGGTNPFADTVNWGWGAHIYNVYHEVPPITVTAKAPTVTVFLRSRTLWPFIHNDAYWDDITLEIMR